MYTASGLAIPAGDLSCASMRGRCSENPLRSFAGGTPSSLQLKLSTVGSSAPSFAALACSRTSPRQRTSGWTATNLQIAVDALVTRCTPTYAVPEVRSGRIRGPSSSAKPGTVKSVWNRLKVFCVICITRPPERRIGAHSPARRVNAPIPVRARKRTEETSKYFARVPSAIGTQGLSSVRGRQYRTGGRSGRSFDDESRRRRHLRLPVTLDRIVGPTCH